MFCGHFHDAVGNAHDSTGVKVDPKTPTPDLRLNGSHLDKGKFASEWGMWSSISLIVAGMAAIAGGFLARTFGFQLLFTLMFALSICGLIASTFLLKRKPFKKPKGKSKFYKINHFKENNKLPRIK